MADCAFLAKTDVCNLSMSFEASQCYESLEYKVSSLLQKPTDMNPDTSSNCVL